MSKTLTTLTPMGLCEALEDARRAGTPGVKKMGDYWAYSGNLMGKPTILFLWEEDSIRAQGIWVKVVRPFSIRRWIAGYLDSPLRGGLRHDFLFVHLFELGDRQAYIMDLVSAIITNTETLRVEWEKARARDLAAAFEDHP
jgi:hypothetical protein